MINGKKSFLLVMWRVGPVRQGTVNHVRRVNRAALSGQSCAPQFAYRHMTKKKLFIFNGKDVRKCIRHFTESGGPKILTMFTASLMLQELFRASLKAAEFLTPIFSRAQEARVKPPAQKFFQRRLTA